MVIIELMDEQLIFEYNTTDVQKRASMGSRYMFTYQCENIDKTLLYVDLNYVREMHLPEVPQQVLLNKR